MSDPTQVKHYEILSRLGEGGMGVVYRARDTRLGRTVALKMLSGKFGPNVERSQRFEREARIVSSISHPGIATLFDFDIEGETAFLTMELVDGPTLREVLKEGPMPLDRLLDCGAQVASAIAAAHEHGVVHRDLKPENIMVTRAGYYKVLDFGVAHMEDTPPDEDSGLSRTETPTRWLTRAGMMMGTVAYMSPEQVSGEVADARSDIFALGSLLYEMATGCSAFTRGNDMATLHAIAYEPPNIPTHSEVRIPRGLALIFEKCLAKKPDDRYGSAKELAADLTLLRQQNHGVRGTLKDLNAFPLLEPRRLPRWMALTVAFLAGLGLLGWVAVTVFDRAAVDVTDNVAPVSVESAALLATLMPAPVPRIIVAYFENQTGDPSLGWISNGLPQMLTTDLSRSKELEMIATQRLHDLLVNAGKDASMPLDRSTTAELARWARADIVISGSVFKLGEQYRIDVQAYDVETGTLVAAQKVSGVELFAMVEEISAGLLLDLTDGETHSPEMLRPTQSEDAFRAFTNGKTLYANLQYGEAAENFRMSMEHDAEFALPRIHLATSLLSMGAMEEGLIVIDQVLEHPDNLPEDDRLLAQGLNAFFSEGDVKKGTDLFNELIERFPRNTEARVWMARVATEFQGDSMEGIRQLRAALKIDRDYLPAVVSLADEMARLGAVDESQALLQSAADRCPQAADAIEARMK